MLSNVHNTNRNWLLADISVRDFQLVDTGGISSTEIANWLLADISVTDFQLVDTGGISSRQDETRCIDDGPSGRCATSDRSQDDQ